MSDGVTGGDETLPEAEVHGPHQRQRRRISTVWIIPLVAGVIAAGLAYRTISERGPLITITFKTASGLEAGKTTIRYLDVEIGTVEDIHLAKPDLDHVIVTARLVKPESQVAVEGTRFWVVRPRIGAGGISGLGTLVSGDYIAVDPGPADGKRRHAFTGLERPPMNLHGTKGLHVLLDAPKLSGLAVGSHVFHRNIVVGKIDGYELNADGESVTVHAFINEPYVEFVRANTRFWNASGIDVSVGMNGVEVDMESLASLIEGGIAFDTPGSPGDAATTGARYTLYRHRDDAMGSRKAMRGRHFVLGSPKLGGVSDGSKVYYRDVPVGQVERHEVSEDGGSVDIHIVVESRHADLVRENSRFWNASGIEFSGGFSGVDFSMESIQSVIAGGVAFDTPSGRGKPAKSDARFTLHANRRDAMRVYAESRGLDVIVETPRLGSLKVGDSVYYREEPVGRVVSHELHADGRSVGILLEIDRPYAKLVRTNTIFWNASGFSADLSLTGIHVHTESMAALLSGGVGFATPDNPGPRAAAGSVFELQSKMKDDWLKWSPRIWVGPEGKDPGRSAAAAAGTPVKEKPPVKVHHKPEAAKDKESHHWFPHLRHRRH